MNINPLVSVIIPCYNHESYILECLDSVINNDYKNIEIVVINDGSTDESASVIRKWIDDNSSSVPILFTDRENRGLAKTLNELVQTANGSYITLLASDDMLTPYSISVRVKSLQGTSKLVVVGDAQVIDSESKIILQSAIVDLYHGDKANYLSDEKLKDSVIKQWSVPGPVMMAKKEVYNVIGPYPENILAEDLNFYLHVIGKELLLFIDETVALYRVHDLNMCRNPKHKKKIVASIIKSYVNNIQYYSNSRKVHISYLILRNMLGYVKKMLI
ncbi:glycosyltransferase family A protein [Mucilaginibacter galii]|uniref:Glycosyltransferase 2-like domain-containing protein n=1 Tax=Mucilaginibacter galii TaxID=2005073 RepID=A0A917JCA5_9SPHI|nr:glycosyltransferase family A protein [Mucilaginibacter galii]GGI51461.1 hypothetical protein GCM10011425_26730 [Mucilaginibacter galii]